MTTLGKIRENCNRINEIASELPYGKHREIQELLCEIDKDATLKDIVIEFFQKYQEPKDDKYNYCEHNFTPYQENTGEFTEQEPCDDVISRQAVLNEVNKKFNEINIILENLSSVQSKQKTGHWIDTDSNNAICSCCNRLNHLYGDYCKHCGTRIESENVDSD